MNSISILNAVLIVLALSLSLHYAADGLVNMEPWALGLVGVLASVLVISLFFIHRLPQSPQQLAFKVTKLFKMFYNNILIQ